MDFCIYHRGDRKRAIGIDAAGRPRLQELTDYIVEVEEEEIPSLPGLLEPFPPKGEAAKLNFGNSVGRASLLGREVVVESRKITPEQFNRMLGEISSEISNLPFDFNTPVSFAFERSSPEHPDVLYQSFAYLRQIVLHDSPGLPDHFGVIEGNPHRTTLRVRVDRDLSVAYGVKPLAVLSAVSRPHLLVRVREGERAYDFPCAMEPRQAPDFRLVPSVVLDEHIEVTYDNPENRFIKAFLRQASRIASQMRLLLDAHFQESGPVFYPCDMMDEVERVIGALERMEHAGFLADVGELALVPASSQVLHRAAGYREFFTHFHRLALASRFPIDGESVRHILEGKDAATLYEYWCFFAVAATLRELLGKPTRAAVADGGEFAAGLKNNIALTFPGGVRLEFNRSYPGGSRRSYSVTLRPDITLRVGYRVHLFDAKFKYDRPTFVEEPAYGEGGLDALEAEEEVRQRFKLGDLYKMHTYKDAIVDARDVWILYPGTEFRFFEEGRGRVDRLEDIGELVGVGAIPLKPLGNTMTLRNIIERTINIRN